MNYLLSPSQKRALEVLYTRDCMIMYDGWVTGGWGIKINMNTVKSLVNWGLISGGKLTDRGNELAKTLFDKSN